MTAVRGMGTTSGRAPQLSPVPAGGSGMDGSSNFHRLKPRAIWSWLVRQPLSYWFISAYVFFEYVRPQQIYEVIAGPPYAQIAILAAAATFVLEGRSIRFELPDALLTLFAFVVVASSVTGISPQSSYAAFSLFFSWVLIYLLIANSVDTEDRYLVFMLAYLLYSFKMSQHGAITWAQDGFVFRSWGAAGAPGWFSNSGEFGIQMCMFLPLIISFITGMRARWSRTVRVLWWLAASTGVVSIVASSSRGSQLGLLAIVMWAVMRSKRRVRAVAAALLVGIGAYLALPAEQKARFDTMGDDQTSTYRTTYWKNGIEIMNQNPVFGIGYANWLRHYEANYPPPWALSHNIFVEAGSELGYSGLIAFVALIGGTFVVNYRTRKMARKRAEAGDFVVQMAHGVDGALIGFLVSGFFVTVLYYPFFWINLALAVSLNRAARVPSLGQDRAVKVVATRMRGLMPTRALRRVG